MKTSSSNIEMHLQTIKEVLKTLNVSKKRELIVFNKIDLIEVNTLSELKRLYPKSLFISAQKDLKINELSDAIQEKLSELNKEAVLDIPYQQLPIIDYIYKTCKIINRVDEYEKVSLKVESSSANIKRIQSMIKQS